MPISQARADVSSLGCFLVVMTRVVSLALWGGTAGGKSLVIFQERLTHVGVGWGGDAPCALLTNIPVE